MRRATTALALSLSLALAGQAAADVRRSVERETVRLADLFDFAGASGETAVGPAPRPGQTEVYDADRLRAIAARFHLAWPAGAMAERLVLERAARVLELDEIVGAVRTALAARGIDPDAEIEVDGRTRRLHVAAEAKVPVRAYDVTLDPRTSRFAGMLALGIGAEATEPVPVSGRVVQTAEIAALVRDVGAGEILGPSDVQTLRVRRDLVRRTTVTDPRELIGKVARRPLREGIAINVMDVQEPVVVAKGAIVTLVFQTPRLLLTAKGRAMQNAAMGDVVAVVNTQSNKTVEGIVTGPDQVQIPTNVAMGQ